MTQAEVAIRAFAPDDWDAVCAPYEPAARFELALSGTDPRAFRPCRKWRIGTSSNA